MMRQISNQVLSCCYSALKKPAAVVVLLAAMLVGGPSGVSHAADHVRPSDYIPADFCAAIVIHPQRMAKSPLVKSLPFAALLSIANRKDPDDVGIQALLETVKADKVQRLVMVVYPIPGGNALIRPGLIVQYSEDIDGAGVLAALIKNSVAAEYNGKSYQRGPGLKIDLFTKTPFCGHIVDSRTLLIANEPILKKMLSAQSKDNRLLAQLKKADFKHDLIIEYVAAPMLKAAERHLGKTIDEWIEEHPQDEATRTVRDVTSLSIALDLSGDTLFRGIITTPSDEAAEQMESRVRQGRQMALKQFEAAKPALGQGVPPEFIKPINSLAEQLKTDLTISRSGREVRVVLPMPAALLELSRVAGKMLGDADKP